MCWIDQEGNEDLAYPGLGRVFETERLNLVLVNVREGDATTLNGLYASKILQTTFLSG